MGRKPDVMVDYVKRVRVQYERTEVKKRHLLGAELASRLTGKAWDIVSAEVDHGQLQRRDGPAYLLRFLEDRLCKAPVPDTGQRLEDFFLRLRRAPGSSMAEWATQVRESYRRLQRAMARQRKDLASRVPPTRSRSSGEGDRRNASDVTSPRANTDSGARSNPGHGVHEEPDDPQPAGYEPVSTDDPDARSNNDGWTAEEWEAWYWQRRRRDWDSESTDWWDDTPIEWDQFDFSTEQILPQEILGWILLRRSGLPANARLSVLSATNNRLDLESMERAMRDQEEELLAAEAQRLRGDHVRPRRSFWVEENSSWGMLPDNEGDEVDESSILWVGRSFLLMFMRRKSPRLVQHGPPFYLMVRNWCGNGMMTISTLRMLQVFSGHGRKPRRGLICRTVVLGINLSKMLLQLFKIVFGRSRRVEL